MAKVKKKLNLRKCAPLTSISEDSLAQSGASKSKFKKPGVRSKKCDKTTSKGPKAKKGGKVKKKGKNQGTNNRQRRKNPAEHNQALCPLPQEKVHNESLVDRRGPPLEQSVASDITSVDKSDCTDLPVDNIHDTGAYSSSTVANTTLLLYRVTSSTAGQSSPTIDDICHTFQYPTPGATEQETPPTCIKKSKQTRKRKKSVDEPKSPSPPCISLPPGNHDEMSNTKDQSENSSKPTDSFVLEAPKRKRAKPAGKKQTGRKQSSRLSASAQNNKKRTVQAPTTSLDTNDSSSTQTESLVNSEKQSQNNVNCKASKRSKKPSLNANGSRTFSSCRDASPPVDVVTTPRQPIPTYHASSPSIDSSGSIALSQSAKPGESPPYSCELCSYETSERGLLSEHKNGHLVDKSQEVDKGSCSDSSLVPDNIRSVSYFIICSVIDCSVLTDIVLFIFRAKVHSIINSHVRYVTYSVM